MAIIASRVGYDHIVQLLLDHAVNMDLVDQDGDAPLHFALLLDRVVIRRGRDAFPLGVETNSSIYVSLIVLCTPTSLALTDPPSIDSDRSRLDTLIDKRFAFSYFFPCTVSLAAE